MRSQSKAIATTRPTRGSTVPARLANLRARLIPFPSPWPAQASVAVSTVTGLHATGSVPRRRSVVGRRRPERSEASGDDRVSGIDAGCVAGHGRDEVVAGQRIQLDVRSSPDSGRAWDVAKECDLAEVLAWPERARRSSVDRHLHLSLGDDVEEISRVALAAD